MTDQCPKCETEMERMKDWEDEWKICPNCHKTKKINGKENFEKPKNAKPDKRNEIEF